MLASVTGLLGITIQRLAARHRAAGAALGAEYASESAFSHAFRRIVGMSPAQYRRLPQMAEKEETLEA